MPYTQEWIESAMERLEEAERERERHERALESVDDPTALRMHSEAIEALDEEIQDLYAKLEAAAAELEAAEAEGAESAAAEDGPGEAAPEPEPEPAAAGAAPAASADDGSGFEDPFGSPFGGTAQAPTQAPAEAAATAGFEPSSDFGGAVDLDDDLPKSGGALKWVALVVVLGGAGAGGFYWWQGQQKKAAQSAQQQQPAGPVKVIKAAPVPEDTQGPQVAKGGEATRTPGLGLSSNGKRRSGGGGRSPAAPRRTKKDDGRTLQVDDTRDPLAGVK